MPALKVLLVDDNPDRAAEVRRALSASGCEVMSTLSSPLELYRSVGECAPDVIIIDTESPSRDSIEHIAFVSRDQPRPIVMFCGDRGGDTIRAALRAGVTAYIVDGLSESRIEPILQVAIERFDAEQSLKRELADAKTQLAERKLVDRAKGIIMKRNSIDEDAAFHALRKFAMDRGIKMAEAAEQVIRIADVIG